MLRCWAGTGVPDGRSAGRADGCLCACHASPTPGSRESRWKSSRRCRLLCVASGWVSSCETVGEMARGLRHAGELLAATICASLRAARCPHVCGASGARPRSRFTVDLSGRREGTGAKVVQSAEVCNNCARSFAHLILHVDGCQTKLSHFDAVACNTEQCPDRFHARRRAPTALCAPVI